MHLMNENRSEAPGWVLPIVIIVLLTMQLSLKVEDARAQQIDTLYGETTQYIDKLQWWDHVPQSVRDDFNKDPTKIWSPHPIGFLIHLQEIIKVSKDVS